MITKFQKSWELFKASVAVTLRHRKLLWFPVLITCFTTVLILFFLSAMTIPLVLHHTGYHLDQKQHWVALSQYYLPAHGIHPQSAGWATAKPADMAAPLRSRWFSICFIVIYFVSMFLATFFNVAFYSEIIAALHGRGVSFRRGLSTAWSRLPSILAWSLLAGLVGWLIRSIEERLPFVARIVAGLIGVAWSIAAVFAIPVIIQEQPIRNPLKILKQSAMTLKRTWGEGLIGYVGFSAGNMMILMGSLVPLVAAAVMAFLMSSMALAVIAGSIWFISIFLMFYISSVANHVYRCALYLYAAEGVVPEPYNQELLDMAWKVKSK
jgi:hypothetical protein